MTNSKKVVILTGAGISAESGLKTFRATDGLWEEHRIDDVASPEGWRNNPQLVLDFYNQRRRDVLKANPNKGHKAISELEEKFEVVVITQNIDNLHERAGSSKVIHLHGEILKSRSTIDSKLIYKCEKDILIGDKCEKGSQLRPFIVWFNEAVPMIEIAAKEVSSADIFIIAGTSLQVYPAAGLINYVHPMVPKFLVDPNIPDVNFLKNIVCIEKKGSEGMPELAEKLLKIIEQ